MDHSRIDNENWVERYVLRQLSAEQAEQFEAHYLDCPRCLEQLELTQRLHDGLREVAAEDAARQVVGAGVLGWLRSRALRRSALAVGLCAVLATSAWLVSQGPQEPPISKVVQLAQERGSAADPSRTVLLPQEPRLLVLTIELPTPEPGSVLGRLQREGETVWNGAAEVAADGSVAFGVDSATLTAGSYVLEVERPLAGGPPAPLGRYPFRIHTPDSP
ncbi:MAG: zf-HC2 domain-containing protein [Acidobacteriota bacterium]